jgi:hypothetical protein
VRRQRQAGERAFWFYPTIGAGIAAGLPWLSFSCPACGQVDSVDLRTRHPGASMSSVMPSALLTICAVRQAGNADLPPRHFASVRLRQRVLFTRGALND